MVEQQVYVTTLTSVAVYSVIYNKYKCLTSEHRQQEVMQYAGAGPSKGKGNKHLDIKIHIEPHTIKETSILRRDRQVCYLLQAEDRHTGRRVYYQ